MYHISKLYREITGKPAINAVYVVITERRGWLRKRTVRYQVPIDLVAFTPTKMLLSVNPQRAIGYFGEEEEKALEAAARLEEVL